MYVKPRTPDLRVMDPATGQYLPPEGREVPDTDYWRRLRDLFRDVVETDPPAAGAAPDAAPDQAGPAAPPAAPETEGPAA